MPTNTKFEIKVAYLNHSSEKIK